MQTSAQDRVAASPSGVAGPLADVVPLPLPPGLLPAGRGPSGADHPLVGYLILAPAGTDPAALLNAVRAELAPAGSAVSPRSLHGDGGEAGGGSAAREPQPAAPPGATGAPAPTGAPESAPDAGGPGTLPVLPATEAGRASERDVGAVRDGAPGSSPAAAEDVLTGARTGSGDRSTGVWVDPTARTVTVDGRALELTYLEYELLALLIAHPQRVYSRDQLVSTVWGYGPVGDRRTVDVHVARLRRKLGAGYRERIVTVHRVGYKYVAGDPG